MLKYIWEGPDVWSTVVKRTCADNPSTADLVSRLGSVRFVSAQRTLSLSAREEAAVLLGSGGLWMAVYWRCSGGGRVRTVWREESTQDKYLLCTTGLKQLPYLLLLYKALGTFKQR